MRLWMSGHRVVTVKGHEHVISVNSRCLVKSAPPFQSARRSAPCGLADRVLGVKKAEGLGLDMRRRIISCTGLVEPWCLYQAVGKTKRWIDSEWFEINRTITTTTTTMPRLVL